MIPSKKYTPDDIAVILWHWKWLIVVPCLVGGLGAFAYARTLKDIYRSESVVMMTPPRVREDLVRSTVRASLADRIQTISQQIMSRTRLEGNHHRPEPVPEERRTGLMEDVVERMRKDVTVEVVRGDAFKVAYVSESPVTAMRVTERLAGLFIDENLKDREDACPGHQPVPRVAARRRPPASAGAGEAARGVSAGQRRPAALAVGIEPGGHQQRPDAGAASAGRHRQGPRSAGAHRASDCRSDVARGLAAEPSSMRRAGRCRAAPPRSSWRRRELRSAHMELRLKPEHPDIGRMRRLIATLEQKAAEEALEVPLTPDGAPQRPKTKAEADPVDPAARDGPHRRPSAQGDRGQRGRAGSPSRDHRGVPEAAGCGADARDRDDRADARLRHVAEAVREPAGQERGIEAVGQPGRAAGRPAVLGFSTRPESRHARSAPIASESTRSARLAAWRWAWAWCS